jgi:hypothetical protein
MTMPLESSATPAEADRVYDVPELNAYLFNRFLGVEPEEVRELCVLPPSPKLVPYVAYATSDADAVRLMRESAGIPRGTGCYVVPSKIKSAIAARYGENRWHRADAGRAADHEIEEVRAVYIDCDVDRPKGISSTDTEKDAAYSLLRLVEDFFISELGDDRALGRGDSGNGYSLFIAVEPFMPTKENGERLRRLLEGLALKFQVVGAKIDTSVWNPARLVPAFGTMKTKGANTAERPHRPTYFVCRPSVRRIPLEVLA